jgi:molybdopterin molybdotransferase
MKFNRPSVEVTQAQQLLAAHVKPLSSERVPLLQSFGRRLAEEVHATHPVPHFKKSGMDGYAVRAADIEHATPERPALLEVNQVIPCGSPPSRPITAGQAARIMTGAPLPEGADTVVMFEMTEERQEDGKTLVAIFKNVAQGRNTSQIGEELSEGDFLLERGRTIGAGEAALLATFGCDTVPVVRRPRVAILTTGSELLPVEAALQPAKIRNSNRYMLAALIESAGGEIVTLDAVPDDVELARAFVGEQMVKADLIVTSGGVSVGDFDIMADLLDRWDGELLFNKVEMRPGSVTSAAVRDGVFLCALSGNPGACFVGFELFVRPVLNGMQARQEIWPTTFTARLQADYPKGNIYARYLRGRMILRDGVVYVEPVGKDQSSVTVSIKDADCLILIPPGGGVLSGETVTALRLPFHN